MKLIDVSRPLFTGMPVWPGDTPTQFEFAATKAGGYSCNVGRLRTSMHAGTHVDAPYHYRDDGAKIDEIALDTYVGPARVVDIRGVATVTPEHFAGLDLAALRRRAFAAQRVPILENQTCARVLHPGPVRVVSPGTGLRPALAQIRSERRRSSLSEDRGRTRRAVLPSTTESRERAGTLGLTKCYLCG